MCVLKKSCLAVKLCCGEIWSSPNKLTSTEIDEVLKAHNEFRAGVGASNMLKLRWDPTLAELAQGINYKDVQ